MVKAGLWGWGGHVGMTSGTGGMGSVGSGWGTGPLRASQLLSRPLPRMGPQDVSLRVTPSQPCLTPWVRCERVGMGPAEASGHLVSPGPYSRPEGSNMESEAHLLGSS